MVVCCSVAVWLSKGTLAASTSWAVFGALSGAVLGLFRDPIVRWIWFPELELTFRNAAPYCDDPPDPKPDPDKKDKDFPVPTIWFRALVINRGTARAENV